MSTLQAIILGIVQGLTEFLPVSSSGHLVIVPELLGYPAPGLAFDVLLHIATLAAVVAYFARELAALVCAFVVPSRLPRGEVLRWRRLTLWLIVGSIPATLAGLLLADFFESLFASTLAVGIFLLVTSGLLFLADLVYKRAVERREVDRITVLDALVTGVFQALAICPGISRSGATMSAGIYMGLTRDAAARFSFLLSIPVILGAGLLKVPDLAGASEGGSALAYVLGALAAGVSGFLAVSLLLRYVRRHGFRIFEVYTLIFGLFVIVLSLA